MHASAAGTARLSVVATRSAHSVVGYWLTSSVGGVYAFHAPFFGSSAGKTIGEGTVAMAANPDGGYWLAMFDGRVVAIGTRSYGGARGKLAESRVVGIAATPSGNGYWLVTSKGRVFAFGEAKNYGSASPRRLRAPIVAMAGTTSGKGYWLASSAGQVLAFGDAQRFLSSTHKLYRGTVVSIVPTTSGRGYWLTNSKGQVVGFGNARNYGSLKPKDLRAPIVGMAASPSTGGYWLVASNGGVYAFHARFLGSLDELGSRSTHVVGMVSFTGFAGARASLLRATSLALTTPQLTATADTFTYNGDGLRMTESDGVGTEQFTWSTYASSPELLVDSNATYIYGPAGLPIEQIATDGKVDFYFHDGLGSTRLLLGSHGSVDSSFSYSPYGSIQSQTGTVTTPFGYAGGYRDSDSGLYYLIHRYYDPGTREFISVDPIVMLTEEPYQYAEDNPIANTDLLGLSSGFWLCFGICVGYQSGQGWGGGFGLGGSVNVGHLTAGVGTSTIAYPHTGQLSWTAGFGRISVEIDEQNGHITNAEVCTSVLCSGPLTGPGSGSGSGDFNDQPLNVKYHNIDTLLRNANQSYTGHITTSSYVQRLCGPTQPTQPLSFLT